MKSSRNLKEIHHLIKNPDAMNTNYPYEFFKSLSLLSLPLKTILSCKVCTDWFPFFIFCVSVPPFSDKETLPQWWLRETHVSVTPHHNTILENWTLICLRHNMLIVCQTLSETCWLASSGKLGKDHLPEFTLPWISFWQLTQLENNQDTISKPFQWRVGYITSFINKWTIVYAI